MLLGLGRYGLDQTLVKWPLGTQACRDKTHMGWNNVKAMWGKIQENFSWLHHLHYWKCPIFHVYHWKKQRTTTNTIERSKGPQLMGVFPGNFEILEFAFLIGPGSLLSNIQVWIFIPTTLAFRNLFHIQNQQTAANYWWGFSLPPATHIWQAWHLFPKSLPLSWEGFTSGLEFGYMFSEEIWHRETFSPCWALLFWCNLGTQEFTLDISSCTFAIFWSNFLLGLSKKIFRWHMLADLNDKFLCISPIPVQYPEILCQTFLSGCEP